MREVNRLMSQDNAKPLVQIGNATLEQFEVAPGRPWLCSTIDTATGRATGSSFSDDCRRGVLR
jgi:hypothetical protein